MEKNKQWMLSKNFKKTKKEKRKQMRKPGILKKKKTLKNIKESKKNRGIRQKTSQNQKNYAKTFKQWILSKTFIKKRKWETKCENKGF